MIEEAKLRERLMKYNLEFVAKKMSLSSRTLKNFIAGKPITMTTYKKINDYILSVEKKK